jgi:hypothetical protein
VPRRSFSIAIAFDCSSLKASSGMTKCHPAAANAGSLRL